MSLLGKVYLLVSLILLALGLVWTIVTLGANTGWVEVVLYLPAADLSPSLVRRRFEVHSAALMAGWVVTVALLAVAAIRAPFRIRAAAIAQRRTRELEREVLELRTLPLRQEDEDELLAREAHLSDTRRPVMLGASAQSMAATRAWPGSPARREGDVG
ncbi:hypothetical protein OV203_38845 [Nannocystis sp. ILAH1]|uniref:hypothetical protein n=1 Tax=unclassified Nannocystis TaxID=2627009 RepID=UPI002271AD64|nr:MULTISPECIES: hypothetical protein [unclassified Nannocystis]MCY0993162.1 hypothetical protein [Nannocystis sp. ILAH1]MCY1063405.1 hypothetical protein [Nannocystis sp. RBIL2]